MFFTEWFQKRARKANRLMHNTGGVFHYIIKLRKIFLSNRAKENMVPCANTTRHDAIYIRVPASNHHESAFSEVIS